MRQRFFGLGHRRRPVLLATVKILAVAKSVGSGLKHQKLKTSGVIEKPGGSGPILEALNEGCIKAWWRVHAYYLMSNHFHLILETPPGNLAAGMR